jgi:hypothetical protein
MLLARLHGLDRLSIEPMCCLDRDIFPESVEKGWAYGQRRRIF